MSSNSPESSGSALSKFRRIRAVKYPNGFLGLGRFLQQVEQREQDQDLGQEDHDGAHAGDQSVRHEVRQFAKTRLEPIPKVHFLL